MSIPQSMQAAVYIGNSKIDVQSLPVPKIEDREILVRLRNCGICGTDLKKISHNLLSAPRVFGHEMAGDIVETGSKVEKWKVGDRVAVMHHVPCMNCYYCSHKNYAQCPIYKKTGTTAGFEPSGGGYAEYIRVMDWVVERGLVLIPEHGTYEQAAFIEPVNTVLKGIERCQPHPGMTAVVFGLGQIGLLFVQCLKVEGITVIGVDPIESRRDGARSFAADLTCAPEEISLQTLVKEQTEGRGVDLSIIAVPGANAPKIAISITRPGGKVLLFAHTRLNDYIELDGGAVCMLEKDVIGSYSSDIDLQEKSAEYVFNKVIDVEKLITHHFPLEKINDAIELALNPRDNSLKVMVDL